MHARGITAGYHALRIREDADALNWWVHVHAHSHTAPPAVRALLTGRTRVELSAAEASDALAWASQQPGWSDHAPTPLSVYPPIDGD